MLHLLLFLAIGVAAALAAVGISRRTVLVLAAAAVSAEVTGWAVIEAVRPAAVGSVLSVAVVCLAAAAAAGVLAPTVPRWWARAGWGAVVLGGLVLLLVLWAHPYPNLPFYRDSAAYAYLGQRLLHGELPHRDYWDQKPGGIAAVDALALAFGKPVLPSLFWLDLAWSTAVVVAAAWALRPVASGWAAIPAVAWLVLYYRSDANLQGGNLTEQYAVLPMLIAAGAGLRALGPPGRPGMALVAGAAAAAAATFKPTAATAVVALVVAAAAARALRLRGTWVTVAVAVAGAASAGALLVVAAFIAAGAPPGRLYDETIAINRLYETGIGRATVREFWAAVTADHWQLFIPALALGAGVVTAWSRERAAQAVFLVTMTAVDVYGLVLPGYYYGHYFLLLAPAGALAIGWGAEGIAKAARGGIRSGAARLGHLPAATIGAAGLVLTATHFPIVAMTQPVPLGAVLRGAEIPIEHGSVIADIEDSCGPDQRLFVWAFEPQLYVLSGRASSTRYIYTTPLQLPGYDNQARIAEVVQTLTEHPPCLIVDASPDDSAVPSLDTGARARWRPLPDRVSSYLALGPIYAYVEANYRSAERVDGLTVYRPRD